MPESVRISRHSFLIGRRSHRRWACDRNQSVGRDCRW